MNFLLWTINNRPKRLARCRQCGHWLWWQRSGHEQWWSRHGCGQSGLGTVRFEHGRGLDAGLGSDKVWSEWRRRTNNGRTTNGEWLLTAAIWARPNNRLLLDFLFFLFYFGFACMMFNSFSGYGISGSSNTMLTKNATFYCLIKKGEIQIIYKARKKK